MTRQEKSLVTRRRLLQFAGAAGALTLLPGGSAKATTEGATEVAALPPCPFPNLKFEDTPSTLMQTTGRFMKNAGERVKFNANPFPDLDAFSSEELAAFYTFNPPEISHRVNTDLHNAATPPNDDQWKAFYEWNARLMVFPDCWPANDPYVDGPGCKYKEPTPAGPSAKTTELYTMPSPRIFADGVTVVSSSAGGYDVTIQGEGLYGASPERKVEVSFRAAGQPVKKVDGFVDPSSTFRCGILKVQKVDLEKVMYEVSVRLLRPDLPLNGVATITPS